MGLLNSPVPNQPAQATGQPAPTPAPQPVGQPPAAPAAPQTSNDGAPPTKDQSLVQIEKGIEANVKPQDRKAYLAVVVSGNQILFSQDTMHLLIKIVKQANFMSQLPNKVANLLALISNHSGKNAQGQPLMNPALVGPAAAVLACHIMDFAESAAGVKLNPNIIATTLHDVIMASLQKFGIGSKEIEQIKKQHAQPAQPPVQPQQTAPQPPQAGV